MSGWQDNAYACHGEALRACTQQVPCSVHI